MRFSRYFPSGGGSIIITTRLIECQNFGVLQSLDDLGYESAIELLLKACYIDENDRMKEMPHARSVINILGQHALALVHAGAYIRKAHCTLEEYPEFFRKQRRRLMQYQPAQLQSRHGSIYTTFEVSAEVLTYSNDHDSQVALSLLKILAFLDREDVREDMLERALTYYRIVKKIYATKYTNDPASGLHDILGQTNDDLSDTMLCHGLVLNSVCECDLISDGGPAKGFAKRGFAGSSSITTVLDEDGDSRFSPRNNKSAVDGTKSTRANGLIESPTNDAAEPDAGSFHETAPECKVEDDEIDHLDLWHCSQVESTGLFGQDFPSDLRAARVRLAELSLIRVQDNTMSMHPLVHEWARMRLDQWEQHDAWNRTAYILALSIQRRTGWQPFTVTIRSHIESCFEKWPDRVSEAEIPLSIARTLYFFGWQLYRANKNFAALKVFQALCARYHPSPHTSTYKSLNLAYCKVVCLARSQNKEHLQEAESLLEQIIHTTNRWLSKKSRGLIYRVGLAKIYDQTNKWTQAVSLLELAMAQSQPDESAEIRESFRATMMDSLADLYVRLGQNQKAIALLEKVVCFHSQALLPDHPSRLSSMSLLATAYFNLGNDDQAVKMLENVVRIQARTLPLDEPFRLDNVSRLGQAYVKLSCYAQAIPLLLEAVEREPISPELDISRRLRDMISLGRAYIGVGRSQATVNLLREVIATHPKKFSADDGELICMDILALAFINLKRYQEAIDLLSIVINTQAAELPLKDSRRLAAMGRLARAYMGTGRNHEAISLLEVVLNAQGSNIVPPTEDCLRTMDCLATAYMNIDEPHMALDLLENIIKSDSTVRQAADRTRLATIKRLANVYLLVGRLAEAIELFETIVKTEASHVPAEDKQLVTSMDNLAQAYLDAGQNEKAMNLIQKIVDVQARLLKANDPKRLKSIDDLAVAYLRIGDGAKAVHLLEAVVDAEDASLLTEDTERRTLMDRLSEAYLRVGQIQKAIDLLEVVVEAEAKLLPDEDPERLVSERRLAEAYIQTESHLLVIKAISLLKRVIEGGQTTLHTQQKHLLWTQKLLSHAQRKLQHYQQSEQLEQGRAPGFSSPADSITWAVLRLTSGAALMY